MSESTVVMPCNYSGLYDYTAYPELAKFGLVDYDWSNAKQSWANLSPMDCDGSLVRFQSILALQFLLGSSRRFPR